MFFQREMKPEDKMGTVFSWLYLLLGCSSCESHGPEQRVRGPATPRQLRPDRAGPALQ